MKKRAQRLQRILTPYFYLAPSILFLVLFTYWPAVNSFYLSLFRHSVLNPVPIFTWLGNYESILKEEIFPTVVKNTLVYVIGTIPITMFLAFSMAVLINEKIGWLRNIYRVTMFYPTMIPMAAAGMLAVWLFNPSIGLINYYVGKFGIPGPQWLYSMEWALPAIMITAIWKNFGYFMILFLAGLQNINKELYESSELEGAGFFQRLRYITIPLLGSTTLFVVIVGIITSFQVFDLVHIMTQGGPADQTNVIVYYIYQYAFRFWDIGKASALTVLFLIGLLTLIMLLVRNIERKIHYEV